MSDKIIKKLGNLITNFTNKKNIQSILIAISGGQDSILLIKIFTKINFYYKKKIKISFIYVDHQWKKNSYKQVEHIINYIKSIKAQISIYQITQANKSESYCRRQRYNILNQHAIKYQYELIITGHHISDKIETFFQNINRKSGIEGISSPIINNQINSKIFILKPLLDINKENIYWLCKKFSLPIWSDNSNYIYEINRNRIRHELVPYMRNFINTNIENNLQSLINNYYYENEYIKQNVTKVYLKSKHKSRIAINHQYVSKQHFILQIKTIQFFYLYNFNIQFQNKKITKIISNINNTFNKIQIIAEDINYIHILNHQWLYVQIKSR